jgi:hypothetical protein
MLVAVPRNSSDYDELYDVILAKLARFVIVPGADDEWWKTPDTSSDETTDDNTASSRKRPSDNGRKRLSPFPADILV